MPTVLTLLKKLISKLPFRIITRFHYETLRADHNYYEYYRDKYFELWDKTKEV